MRLSASDWVEGGWTSDDSVRLAKLLKEAGVDLIDCSSGMIRAGDKYDQGPGWQVPLAEAVRAGASIATGAVGFITAPAQADEIIRTGKADIVFLAREMMRDAYWPYHAAKALRVADVETFPPKYTYAL